MWKVSTIKSLWPQVFRWPALCCAYVNAFGNVVPTLKADFMQTLCAYVKSKSIDLKATEIRWCCCQKSNDVIKALCLSPKKMFCIENVLTLLLHLQAIKARAKMYESNIEMYRMLGQIGDDMLTLMLTGVNIKSKCKIACIGKKWGSCECFERWSALDKSFCHNLREWNDTILPFKLKDNENTPGVANYTM